MRLARPNFLSFDEDVFEIELQHFKGIVVGDHLERIYDDKTVPEISMDELF